MVSDIVSTIQMDRLMRTYLDELTQRLGYWCGVVVSRNSYPADGINRADFGRGGRYLCQEEAIYLSMRSS